MRRTTARAVRPTDGCSRTARCRDSSRKTGRGRSRSRAEEGGGGGGGGGGEVTTEAHRCGSPTLPPHPSRTRREVPNRGACGGACCDGCRGGRRRDRSGHR